MERMDTRRPPVLQSILRRWHNPTCCSDTSNNAIRSIIVSSYAVSTLAGRPSSNGGWVDGVGSNALFNAPQGVAVDSLGALIYVGDTQNNRIRAIDVSNANVTTLAGSGVLSYADGAGSAALFNGPTSLALDGTAHKTWQVVLPGRVIHHRLDQAKGIGVATDHHPPPIIQKP
jgi:DNA-binding beta-propeller fold protein YncE